MAENLNMFTPQYQSGEQKVIQGLPPQYQAQIDAAMVKRALAQMLMQRGMTPLEGQTVVTGAGAPNRYVPPSILSQIANPLMAVAGMKGMGGANADVLNAMQGYQGEVNNVQRQAAELLSNGVPQAPTGGAAPATAPTPAQPPQLTSDAVLKAYNTYKQSGIPALQGEADKMIPLLGELRKNESDLAMQQKKAAFDSAAKAADPQSVLDAAPTFDVTKLKPAANTVTEQGGTLTTQAPGTGEVRFGPTSETSALARVQQEQQRSALVKTGEGLLQLKEGVIAVGKAAETAKAILELAQDPRTLQGVSHPLEVNELRKWGAVLGGVDLPQSTTNTDVLYMLGTRMVGNGVLAATGGASARSVKEWQAIRDSMGPGGTMTPKALMTEAINTINDSQSTRSRYDRQIGAFRANAQANGIEAPFAGQLDIQDGDIAPVSSGISGSQTERRAINALPPAITPPGQKPMRTFDINGNPVQ